MLAEDTMIISDIKYSLTFFLRADIHFEESWKRMNNEERLKVNNGNLRSTWLFLLGPCGN